MNTTKVEKQATKDLVDKCRVYLLDNFHKFTDNNKIKVALTIISKSLPTQVEGEVTHVHMFEEFISKSIPNRLEERLVHSNSN